MEIDTNDAGQYDTGIGDHVPVYGHALCATAPLIASANAISTDTQTPSSATFSNKRDLDAGNEHPIEHMIGVMCTWFAVCTAEILLPTIGMWSSRVKYQGSGGLFNVRDTIPWTKGGGVHAATVLVFFQFHAALAMLNHSPYNVQFSLPFMGSTVLFGAENKVLRWLDEMTIVGKWVTKIITGQWFMYSVGHHEMHHRKFNFNYGQYCMFYDLWMGTFLEYEGPLSAGEIEARKIKRLKEK
eukprot:CAMPEP_0172552132 /NCGR_PEP_ID=MMETSP1067-20121228/43645_1 /TAXON_ID=265564 ORGANISM="Thalassiosira punctigera, Strain Tpunct2005C2" /NCGR_SAMPLE_ID=MMETSP1067 /ASSEMBLY_ACC=CAM_ASM_000444 /LENGTH=240 /DNA_ID=CAMNT_0013340053 /DNA_START=541 /DNA_END=1264 /DNA_ORIENTATION=-